MSTLHSKLLSLGTMALLGGFGWIAQPGAGAHLPSIASEQAPAEVVLPDAIGDESSTNADAERETGREAGAARSARERAHDGRDAVRSRAAAARGAELERSEPGARGLGAERRGIGAARREAVHALNAAHREATRAVEEGAVAHDGSAAGRGHGRSARATHER